jgi:hypothetical protein
MWDIGNDAGFTLIGNDQVFGQLWKLEDTSQSVIHTLREYSGIESGLCEEIEIEVTVPLDELATHDLPATTFALSRIINTYEIIKDGRWRF